MLKNKLSHERMPVTAYYAWRLLRQKWYGPIVWTFAKWWGIRMGKKCIFNGMVRFWRHPGSKISIDSSCRFNSGENSTLGGFVRSCRISTLKEKARIKIGENCGFSGTVIGSAKEVLIGRNVRCATNTTIFDTDWHFDDPRTGPDSPVIIGDNVWLGYNVMVFKGVTIGENTLVGANSIVTKSLPPNVIAAGSPAKVIRNLTPDEQRGKY